MERNLSLLNVFNLLIFEEKEHFDLIAMFLLKQFFFVD